MGVVRSFVVIKHRAPNGALRRTDSFFMGSEINVVIKHRAPNGALRPKILSDLGMRRHQS